MIISDLNHLEVVEAANVVGGGGTKEYDKFYLDVDFDIGEGNNAKATASSSAYGDDSFTYTATATTVKDDKYSKSASESIASVA